MEKENIVFTIVTVAMVVAFMCTNSLLTGIAAVSAVIYWGHYVEFLVTYALWFIEKMRFGWHWTIQKWRKNRQK